MRRSARKYRIIHRVKSVRSATAILNRARNVRRNGRPKRKYRTKRNSGRGKLATKRHKKLKRYFVNFVPFLANSLSLNFPPEFPMKVGAIIAAAGFGRRMKADRPKQLLALNGIPIIIHTIRKFDLSAVINYIVVTAPRESVEEVRELVTSAGFHKSITVVEGGERRQDSVAAGLEHLQPGTDVVAVHDGVRPFVSADDIANVVRQAERTGGAILGVPIVDTVKQVEK